MKYSEIFIKVSADRNKQTNKQKNTSGSLLVRSDSNNGRM